jgi:hypothetical protein
MEHPENSPDFVTRQDDRQTLGTLGAHNAVQPG